MNYSFPVWFLIILALTICNGFSQSAYPDPGWKKINGPVFASPPSLKQDEQIDNYYQGTIWTRGGYVYWIINYAKDRYGLLRLNMYTGKTKRARSTDTRIRGMAYSFEEDAVVLRKSKILEFYDNKTFKLIKTLPFEKLQNWWKDMTISGDNLMSIDSESTNITTSLKICMAGVRNIHMYRSPCFA